MRNHVGVTAENFGNYVEKRAAGYLLGRIGEPRRHFVTSVTMVEFIRLLNRTPNVCLAAIPALKRAKGAIINLSSAQAHRPSPGLAIYAATKGGVESFTKSLAVELAPAGVGLMRLVQAW